MRVRQRAHAARVMWAPSRLRRVLRHRWVQAAVLVGGALGVGTSLVAMADDLEQQRLAWGATEAVLVIDEQVEPGELLAGSLTMSEVPRALVPPDALGDVAANSRAKVALFPGEVLLRQRVTNGANESGSIPGLPQGSVALTVSIVRLVPLLSEGDLVDLWTVDSANFSSHRVASNVVVLAFSENEITIALHEDQVGEVAASSIRPLTITLVG